MLQDLTINDIHVGDEIYVYGQKTFVTEVEDHPSPIINFAPAIVIADRRYTTRYITLNELILHGKYIYHWRTMTPQELRTIQKNRARVDKYLGGNLNVDYSKYLGPITEEEYEERVAIKNIMGRINERDAMHQAYMEITDYYINKDSLFG